MTTAKDRILCVEDEPSMRSILRSHLVREGYAVRCCQNGEEAMEACHEEPPDLVLLDFMLPDMTGLDICRMLRGRPETLAIPVVMLSAVDEEDNIVECLSAGADDYLLKPFNRAQLLGKVKFFLSRYHERTELAAGLRPGVVVSGRYLLQEKIGAGGFSVVFRALDELQEEEVAVKIFEFPPSSRDDPAFVSAFLREAYELSKVDFPTIVAFKDFGHAGTFYYLVMEYLSGMSLDDYVHENEPLDEENAVALGLQIAQAVSYLETQHMHHRDIKPNNLMLLEDGSVKLLDFGLAKSCSETTIAMPDEILLTPAYSAPEAFFRDEKTDSLSDIYSLGATLYFAVTGTAPFPGASAREVMAKRFNTTPAPIQELNSSISDELVLIIAQMMNPDRDQRFTSEQTAEALMRLLPDE